jgi:high-affinity K+ transport system ATPase subunit B
VALALLAGRLPGVRVTLTVNVTVTPISNTPGGIVNAPEVADVAEVPEVAKVAKVGRAVPLLQTSNGSPARLDTQDHA